MMRWRGWDGGVNGAPNDQIVRSIDAPVDGAIGGHFLQVAPVLRGETGGSRRSGVYDMVDPGFAAQRCCGAVCVAIRSCAASRRGCTRRTCCRRSRRCRGVETLSLAFLASTWDPHDVALSLAFLASMWGHVQRGAVRGDDAAGELAAGARPQPRVQAVS